MSAIRAAIAWLGARLIDGLLWVFGRPHRRDEVTWLDGPLGGPTIGDAPYRDVAADDELTVGRRAAGGGLVPDWDALRSDAFDAGAGAVHPLVRESYEHTADFAIDVGSRPQLQRQKRGVVRPPETRDARQRFKAAKIPRDVEPEPETRPRQRRVCGGELHDGILGRWRQSCDVGAANLARPPRDAWR